MKRKQDTIGILNKSIEKVLSDNDCCFKPGRDFIRSRKLPLRLLVRFLLSMEGNSLDSEIYNYFPKREQRMSASALIQQREKLKPETFKQILYHFNSTLFDVKTLKGMRVYAIDGSDFCTPLNKDSQWYIPNHYIRKDGQEAKGTCLLHGNFLYDLLNKQYMDVCETRDERDGAIKLIKNIKSPKKSLIIMDRGYSGFNMVEHCNRYGGYYVIRFPVTNTIKEINELPNEPCDTDLEIKVSTKSQQFCDIYGYRKINACRNKKPNANDYATSFAQWDFEEKCTVGFRVCKFKINDEKSDNEIWEVLVTNLPKDKFHLTDMKQIYWLRWGIETSFRELKYALGAINFHSKKDKFILQELYAHMVIFNAASRVAAAIPTTTSGTGCVYAVDFKMVVHVFREYYRKFNKAPPNEMYTDLMPYRHLIKKGKQSKRFLRPKSAVYFTYRVA